MTFDFRLPTKSTSVPDGPDWLHEIKYDGYRLRVERDGDRVRRKVVAMAADHGATTILIEDAALGMNLLQDLRANLPSGMTGPIGIKPEGSKVDRMAAQSAKIEAGHVHLPKNAPWLGDFLNELLSFPNGRHDDQVDSVSQFLRWLQNAHFHEIPWVVPFVVSRPREFP
jgi:predicted phage terminase large subunit-like protein